MNPEHNRHDTFVLGLKPRDKILEFSRQTKMETDNNRSENTQAAHCSQRHPKQHFYPSTRNKCGTFVNQPNKRQALRPQEVLRVHPWVRCTCVPKVRPERGGVDNMSMKLLLFQQELETKSSGKSWGLSCNWLRPNTRVKAAVFAYVHQMSTELPCTLGLQAPVFRPQRIASVH